MTNNDKIRNEKLQYDIKREADLKQKDLKYETKRYIYNFQQYEAIRSFGDSIYTHKANIVEADKDEGNLLKNWRV